MYQIFKYIDHLHRNGIFHRDIKSEDIFLMEKNFKLIDFGFCRAIYSKQQNILNIYLPYVEELHNLF